MSFKREGMDKQTDQTEIVNGDIKFQLFRTET